MNTILGEIMSTTHLFNYKYNNVKADNYGRYYWGVTLSDGRDIYVHADRAIITDTGDLMFISDADLVKSRKETVANLVLAQNQWAAYFGANVMTGEPVSLDNSFPVDAEERKVKRTANEDLDSEEKIEVIRTMLNQLASETDKEDVVIAKMALTSIIDQSFRQVK
jgi:hypothetical protein